MTTTTTDYAANIDSEHYLVLMRRSSMVPETAATAHASNGAGLSTWLNTSQAIDGLKVVEASGKESTFEILIGDGLRTVTNAELTSNVAKLTLSKASGAAIGDTIRVRNLASPFASLNATSVVLTAVSNTAPFSVSFALTGTTISAAAVSAGEIVINPYVYPLDGTGKPIRMAALTGNSLSNSTNADNVITLDTATLGDSTPQPLSNSRTMTLAGRVVLKEVGYKIASIIDNYVVSENLAAKFLRIGPQGETEKTFFHALVHSKTEGGDAGAGYTYGVTVQPIGQRYTLYHNAI